MRRCSRDPVCALSEPPTSTTLPLPPSTSDADLGRGLPNEILGAIFDHLSRDALTRVSLVSRRWRANAERLLYSAVVIHEAQMIPAVPITTLRCCETLSARPHLAAYVRRFCVRWDTEEVENPLLLLRIAHDIARALVPTLVHLDSLELSFGLSTLLAAPPWDPPRRHTAPRPCAPRRPHTPAPHQHQHPHANANAYAHHHLLTPFRIPTLRTLALHGLGELPAPDLERVLRSHPALQHLRLGDYRGRLCLAPADVPHLRSFRGHPATAASLLPGRRVHVLGLVGACEAATEEVLARIAAGGAPVRSLDLAAMSVTPALLRSVSRHLSHVEWLKVRLALRHTLHYALSGIRLLTALTTVLSAFYNLRGLDLSPTNAVHSFALDGHGQNAAEEQRLCVAWVAACPSLRHVVFPSRTEWSLSEAGVWTSGSSGALVAISVRASLAAGTHRLALSARNPRRFL
ncbi:hypothetical protein BC826DRAFT_918839 [Russula brevipes]|nr:hypothetical protein BC826DRAFT_918839 [Russula brevipes]